MRSFPTGLCVSKRFVLVLLLICAVCGCKGRNESFACGNQKVDADPTTGAKPKSVYVCAGDTVTWNGNGHTFLVEFKNGSPFDDDGKKFDNAHPSSAKTKHHSQITVYEYRITVDNHVFDPQVIAGGGSN